MRRLRLSATVGDYLNAALKLLAGGAAGQLIAVLAMPVVARVYSPEDFGIFAVFSAFMATVMVGSCFRYELAIPLARSRSGALRLMTLSLLLNASVAVVVGLVTLVCSGGIERIVGVTGLKQVLWLLPFALVCTGGYRVLTFLAVRDGEFGALGVTKIIQGTAGAVVTIGAGVVALGTTGLILGHVTGQSSGAVTLAKHSNLSLRDFKPHWLRMLALARKYSRFPKFDLPAAIVDTGSSQMPNLLLAPLFGLQGAGHYLLAERLISVPLGLIAQALGQVLYSRSRDAVSQGKLTPLLMGISVAVVAVLAPVCLVFSIIAPNLFEILFGAGWREAGEMAGWVMFAAITLMAYSSISLGLQATNGQSTNLIIQGMVLVLKLSGLMYGVLKQDVMSAVVGYSIASFAAYGIAISIVVLRARRSDFAARLVDVKAEDQRCAE